MKKTTAFLFTAVIAACAFTGCSSMGKNGELKKAKSYEKTDCWDFSFDLRSDLYQPKKADIDGYYIYKKNRKIQFNVLSPVIRRGSVISPEVFGYYYNDMVFSDYTGKVKETIDLGTHKASCFKYEVKDQKEGKYNVIDITVSDVPDSISFSVFYNRDKDEEEAMALVKEMAASAVYRGDLTPPKGQQKIRYEKMTINCGPEFVEMPKKRETDNNLELNYSHVDDPSKFHASYNVTYYCNDDFDTAEEYINYRYTKLQEDEMRKRKLTEPEPVEAAGCSGYMLTYEPKAALSLPMRHCRDYYFDSNGTVYHISTTIYDSKNWKKIQDDFDKLLENTVIEPLSEEEQEKIASEKDFEYKTDNFRMRINSKLKPSDGERPVEGEFKASAYYKVKIEQDPLFTKAENIDELFEERSDYYSSVSDTKQSAEMIEVGGRQFVHVSCLRKDQKDTSWTDVSLFSTIENGHVIDIEMKRNISKGQTHLDVKRFRELLESLEYFEDDTAQ